jgi:hypothetical protein
MVEEYAALLCAHLISLLARGQSEGQKIPSVFPWALAGTV